MNRPIIAVGDDKINVYPWLDRLGLELKTKIALAVRDSQDWTKLRGATSPGATLSEVLKGAEYYFKNFDLVKLLAQYKWAEICSEGRQGPFYSGHDQKMLFMQQILQQVKLEVAKQVANLEPGDQQ